MALLDYPDDFLELLRNAARNRSPGAGGDDANNSLPSPVQQPQTQRAPFSFAGPDLVTQATASVPPSRVPAPFPLPRSRPAEAPTGLPSWTQMPTINPSEGFPKLTAENLTTHALRMKGVPEADIAEASGNPEKMRQIINQNYGPRQPDAAAAGRQSAEAAGSPSRQDIGADVARSALSGLEQGIIGYVGMPGDIRTMASGLTDRAGNWLEADPKRVDQFKTIATAVAPRVFRLPTSNEIRSKVEGVAGPLYEPKTEYGHVARTVGEFVPAAFGGGAALIPRLATRVLLPALAAEGAGYAARGTGFEPAARIAGAALGGWGASNWAKELKSALIPNALTELDNGRVASHPLVRGLLSGWLERGNQRRLSGSGQQPDSDATQ